MKRDPYKHKERYENWRKNATNGICGITKANSDVTLKYIDDMEKGINISVKNVKGSRSYIRLNTLREKLVFFAKKFKETYEIDDITNINEEQLHEFFSNMRKGIIKRQDNQEYKSVSDFVKIFKAFWHWHQKVNRKNGNDKIKDITIDLDSRSEKPR